MECGDAVGVRRYTERVGILLGAEFLAICWLGMYLGMRHSPTPFWTIGGWFVGVGAFVVLRGPLTALNEALVA